MRVRASSSDAAIDAAVIDPSKSRTGVSVVLAMSFLLALRMTGHIEDEVRTHGNLVSGRRTCTSH